MGQGQWEKIFPIDVLNKNQIPKHPKVPYCSFKLFTAIESFIPKIFLMFKQKELKFSKKSSWAFSKEDMFLSENTNPAWSNHSAG